MAIGLEVKGYKESEMRAENVTGIAKKGSEEGRKSTRIKPQGMLKRKA
jgi:hypothetical protein